MLSKTILSLLIGATSLVKTSPVPESLNEKRTCGTQLFPNQIVQLSKANPNTAYPNTWNTDRSVKISQDADANGMHTFPGYDDESELTHPLGNPSNQFWELISFPPSTLR